MRPEILVIKSYVHYKSFTFILEQWEVRSCVCVCVCVCFLVQARRVGKELRFLFVFTNILLTSKGKLSLI